MNLKNTLLMAALSLLMSAFTVQAMPGPGSRATYTIIDLGTLGGDTYASAINSRGEVVGSSNLPNGDSRAFLYEKGVMHDIGFLGTSTTDQSIAYAINDSSVVVGESDITPGTKPPYHAFLFNGHMHDLGTLGGGSSYATGINNLGQVVGGSGTANNVIHAFVYATGKMIDIGVLGGNILPNSTASGINQIGEIVGSSTYNFDPISYGYHAFLYANGHMYDLGINPGFEGLDSDAIAINDHGQVIGYTTPDSGGDIVFGFLYSGGVVTKINVIVPVNGPQIGVAPEAINNSGVVTGMDLSVPGRPDGTGFIYRGGVTTDANTLIPTNSGWVINRCTGVNDNGQICGDGEHNGLFRAFVMTPVGSPLLP